MPTILKCYVLINDDNPEAANEELTSLLGGAAFDSSSPVIDFTVHVERHLSIRPDYEDGEFVHHIPPQFDIPANQFARPC